jgi:predicted ABC-type ATPase
MKCDLVIIYDNSKSLPELLYEKTDEGALVVHNKVKFDKIKGMIS